MTANQKSIAFGVGMVLLGLAFVLAALLIVLPAVVNVPGSRFGAMPAFVVMALGIICMYFGGHRLWITTK